jgi:hypothetical protein
MVITQNGTAFSGTIQVTGNTCVRHGTVKGTASPTRVHFGAISAERPIHFAGRIKGPSMSGRWSAIACVSAGGTTTVTGTWHASKVK